MTIKYYYSPGSRGFYTDGLHKNIPADAVEITEARWRELIEDGRQILPDIYGVPINVDRVYNSEELAAIVRAERDAKILQTDWIAVRSMENGQPLDNAIKTYRQALRDIPQQEGFPENVIWPEMPEA